VTVETLRIYVIVVGLLVAIVGGFQWRRWLTYKPENQLAWLGIVVLNAAVTYGTWEIYRQHLPGGSRNVYLCTAMTFLLFAVLYHPTGRLYRRLCRRWRARHPKENP